MGSVYKRGKRWWIQYYQNGKPFQESSKSKKKMVAVALLKQREGDIAKGKPLGIHFDKVLFDELAEDFLADYELNGRKSLERAQFSVNHLKGFFEGMRVVDITTARIKSYIKTRLADGAANATINREMAALKRMLSLGAQDTPPKVDRVPYIPMFQERNVREGFFEHHEYLALIKALPAYLRGPVTFAYNTGWRKSEIFGLTWQHVELNEETVRLEADETKNSEARTVYLDKELLKMFKLQNLRRKKGCDYVFHKDGKKIVHFRPDWNRACREANLGYGYKLDSKYVDKWVKKGLSEGPIMHDFRRTAVRNMVRAGIPEGVAMKISGHKTRTVFERYNIVSASDLKAAAAKHEAYRNGKNSETTAKTTTIEGGKEKNKNHGKLEAIN